MPRMIDLIRASAVPATLVHSAARGGLAIPPPEMLEILVHLATENKVFSDQARLTLAGWDVVFCRTAVSNPSTPKEILSYFSSPQNFRPALLPPLLANPSVPEESLAELARSLGRDLVEQMLSSDRVFHSEKILSALEANPNLNGIQSATIEERLLLLARSQSGPPDSAVMGRPAAETQPEEATAQNAPEPSEGAPVTAEDQEAEEKAAVYIAEHAKEISAEAEKPFQPVGGICEELPVEVASIVVGAQVLASAAVTAVAETSGTAAATAATAAKMTPAKPIQSASLTRGSALQRISKLDVKGRIQLAMKGSKEERALLVRDGTKIVALAVLDSPKISDGEVEKFAGQKNVLEAVLRAIPMKRRFMKQYNIVRNLVFNPRTPIDVSLTLMKNILVADLKNLSGNKEVSDTVRKSALRLFKQKLVVDK